MHSNKDDAFVIRVMHTFFHNLGIIIAKHPWLYVIISTVLTLIMTAKIPFVAMTNDVGDFTPYEARAKLETQAYRNFFSNKGEPVVVFVMITAKNRGNMLGVNEMNDTVQILDKVTTGFRVFNTLTNRNESFSMFCNNFCTINEPVRHFYSGLLVQSADKQSKSGTGTAHIDLGYPITTVLGRQLHMDPNFFGVKIQTAAGNVLSIDELHTDHGHSIFDDDQTQSPNNLKEIKMVVLQIRAERSEGISKDNMTVWEHEIVHYFQSSFKSDYVDVLVMTESFLTSEVVDAGLTLIPFLFIGFVIMCVFSSVTMGLGALYMRQMNIHKITLAIAACVAPFMACGTGLGVMFWCGLRFGSILCVTPFLVLAIGVDDAYLLINGWQRCLAKLRKEKQNGRSVIAKEDDVVARLISEVLVDTGPSITITTLTNILAFGFGALTPTPEIQLFSIGNTVAIFIDYVYVWTIYAALMAIVGKYELRNEDLTNELSSEKNSVSNDSSSDTSSSIRAHVKDICRRFLSRYCRLLSNKCVSSFVLAVLASYWYISIDATMKMKAELKPERLFLETSDVTKIMDLRNEYVIPYYGVCIVFVNNPGNITDRRQSARLHHLVEDFESLPSSLGKFSTKFWLRDYEEFMQYSGEVVKAMPEEFEDVNLEDEEGFEFTQNGSRRITLETSPNQINRRANEVQQFLDWPEFRFWKGFVRYEEDHEKNEFEVTKFFFITAFHGAELRDWSNRATLLNQWREIADKYADLEVTIFEDDSKFLDIIATMAPLTMQSSLATLVCMVLVCVLIIGHATTVFVASFAIVSTCIGVFGFLSLWGVDLDPIVMSATIMSIGFSVDIPAHIAYHYHRAGLGSNARRSVIDRTEHCMAAIGFPVLQAGISTNLCVLSLFFVELHMAQVFMKTMVLVITIGLIHGLVVIPVLFSLLAVLPSKHRVAIQQPTPSINSITPMMVTVNGSSKV